MIQGARNSHKGRTELGGLGQPGADGRHIVELMVPLVLRPTKHRPHTDNTDTQTRSTPAPARSRLRPPGTDWLYAKLYSPPTLENEMIAGPIRSFAQFATAAELADAWFFIRYADPDPHLRIRFHGQADVLVGPLMKALCEWANDLVAGGSCLRFSLDTYEREVERYGGADGVRLAELIFAADSTFVTEIMKLRRTDLPTLDELTVAVVSIDALMSTLGLNEERRDRWYRAHASLSREDGQEYRKRQAVLRRLLGRSDALWAEPGGSALTHLLSARHETLTTVAAQLHALQDEGVLGHPLDELCNSYVHLHCNRLLGSDPEHEQRALRMLRRTHAGLARAPIT